MEANEKLSYLWDEYVQWCKRQSPCYITSKWKKKKKILRNKVPQTCT